MELQQCVFAFVCEAEGYTRRWHLLPISGWVLQLSKVVTSAPTVQLISRRGTVIMSKTCTADRSHQQVTTTSEFNEGNHALDHNARDRHC